MERIAATGHRPERLGGHSQKNRLALGGFAVDYLHRTRPASVITGMALGWDQAIAGACVALSIPFTAALPFPGQANRWPGEARDRWERLLDQADTVETISEHMNSKAMQRRNEWMVDRADSVAALWDGGFGGTHNCILYAEKKGVPVTNLWEEWEMPDDLRELLG